MNTSQIVEEVTKYGGQIAVEGDKLKLSAPSPLPDDLMKEIQKAKPELLAELKPLPHGDCIGCGKDTRSMLTKPDGAWAWMCTRCFDRTTSHYATAQKNHIGDPVRPT